MNGKLISLVIIVILFALLLGITRLTYITYGDLLTVRLNPTHNKVFIQDNRKLMASKKELRRVILFGDSRIAMWGDLLEIDGYQVINRGIGGETIAQALFRVDNDIIAINADSVVIQIGINDLKSIAFLKHREDEILQATKHNILSLVDKLTQKGVKVYLMTILPASEPVGLWRFLWTKKIDDAVLTVNSFIRSLEGEMVSVIDCVPIFNDGKKLNTGYALDTLHLNKAGYALLSDIVRNRVEQDRDLSMDGRE